MPTNVFFNHAVGSEQNLVEDLVVESLRLYGHEVYYLPRKIVDEDSLLGEDPSSKFDDAYMVEMYIENTEGFEGEGDLLSKFGVEVRDQCTFVLAKRTWDRFISLDHNLVTTFRPQEGDLVYFPLGNQVFEIRFVEHENPFYQLGKIFVFKLSCETFEYSHEEIDVGIAELDNIEDQFSYQVQMTLTDGGTGTFQVGETVTQTVATGYTVTGNVVKWEGNTRKLYINNIKYSDTGVPTTYNMFKKTEGNAGNVVGGTSNANWSVQIAPDPIAMTQDPSADNADFETAGDNIIDFSESNPFGTVT